MGLIGKLMDKFDARAQRKDGNRKISLFYSVEYAEKYGYFISSVPDGQGGRKEVNHTAYYSPSDPSFVLVWQGKASERQFVGSDARHQELAKQCNEESARRRAAGYKSTFDFN